MLAGAQERSAPPSRAGKGIMLECVACGAPGAKNELESFGLALYGHGPPVENLDDRLASMAPPVPSTIPPTITAVVAPRRQMSVRSAFGLVDGQCVYPHPLKNVEKGISG